MTTDYPVGKALADALVAVLETGAVESLRGLAAVIRTYGTCAPSALDVVADRIEAALAQAPAENAAAKHWHDLYRKECQLRQDDAARYGQQIVDLEAQAPASGEAVAPFGYCADFETGLYECSHKFYYLAPGQPVPEGCTPFYTTPPAPVPAVRVTHQMVLKASAKVPLIGGKPLLTYCGVQALLEAALGQEKANG